MSLLIFHCDHMNDQFERIKDSNIVQESQFLIVSNVLHLFILYLAVVYGYYFVRQLSVATPVGSFIVLKCPIHFSGIYLRYTPEVIHVGQAERFYLVTKIQCIIHDIHFKHKQYFTMAGLSCDQQGWTLTLLWFYRT